SMNSQMTEVALAGKCPGRGRSDVTGSNAPSDWESARRFSCASRLARPSIPAPPPARHSHSRRLKIFATRPQGNNGDVFFMMAISIDVDELIETEERLTIVSQRFHLRILFLPLGSRCGL